MNEDIKSILNEIDRIYTGEKYEMNRDDIAEAILKAEIKREFLKLQKTTGWKNNRIWSHLSEKYKMGFYKARSITYRKY